jgi:hypothetical protein
MGNIWHQIGRSREARRSYQTAQMQLATLPATVLVSGADGATASDLKELIDQHLRALPLQK